MALLSASNLSKSFGPVDIFQGITLSVPHGARIAIVGPNGVGKSTLLRILLGIEEASSGTVQRARNFKTGYLPQEASLTGKATLWEICLEALEDLRIKESELADLEAAMANPDQANEALERYGKLQREFEIQGGYTYETRIRMVLSGLGFDASYFTRPIPQLSGGQRTRAYLAKLLLSAPDLLILDEPTNHLDIAAVEWLEGYMSQWEGATLLVSHDRYFLDKVVDHIWEMSQNGIEVYRGTYTAYVQQRQERWDLRQQIFETEVSRLEKELDYIKRNISGQNVSQAKGKLKRLSREVLAIEKLGTEAVRTQQWLEISSQIETSNHPLGVAEVERRIRSLHGPSNRTPHLGLNLKASQRSGDLVLRTRNLAVGYADEGKPLFNAPDLLLKRGECAAVIGPNGAGKTTFLKTLLDQLPPLEGELILGASLNIAYFAQAHEGLIPELTLMDEIQQAAPQLLPAEIRNYLARYMFTGEEVYKKVEVLSGGERGRLALAKLSLTNANLLLLDEPTNHLDIPSQEILQESMAHYQGTILLVSHDRYLIDALATQIWEILPDQAYLQIFDGTYTQYREYLEAKDATQAAKIALLPKNSRNRWRERLLSGKEERQRQQRLSEVEALIAGLEEHLALVTNRLEKPPTDPIKVQRLGQDYLRLQNQIDELMQEWELLNE
ncbi:MAG: hypothetical protein A2Z16_00550 [Chloroflexi bacterium RBG_16_54_18]|nr:MAG: hypothetical protein A2Z16_00550 [Chloroflexi bacterium RBG_16_54_18]